MLSFIINIYLLIGIVLFGFNRTTAAAARAIYHKSFPFYALFTICSILLWPVTPLVRFVIIERWFHNQHSQF